MASHRTKRSEMWKSDVTVINVCIWGTFDGLVFNVNFGFTLYALDPKWSLTQNPDSCREKQLKIGT